MASRLTFNLDPLRSAARDLTRVVSPKLTRLQRELPAATREARDTIIEPALAEVTHLARRAGRSAGRRATAIAADPMPLIAGVAAIALTARLLSRRKMRG